MKIVAVSDTHGNHNLVKVPEGDIIIHCGDFTGKSNLNEVLCFIKWFSELPLTYKIFVAGNHDRFIVRNRPDFLKIVNDYNVIYLENQMIQIENLQIFGSPHTKRYGGPGAFLFEDETEAALLWNGIPDDTDVLITHSPPFGIRDFSVSENRNTGCPVLLERVRKLKPYYHIFGHIHDCYGTQSDGNTVFINASLTNGAEEIVNKPMTFSIL